MSEAGFWSRFGSFLTTARIFVANSLFVLLVLIVLIALLSSSDAVVVPDDSALVVNPRGVLVDRKSPTSSLESLFSGQTGGGEVALDDLLTAIDRAATDERIAMLVLRLDHLQNASTGHASTIGEALQRFRETGKQVVAYGSFFSQAQYLIASYADAVYLHPMGQILLSGYGGNQLYFKELLEKLDVNIHIFRVGKYKEFVEPYTRTSMSAEARLARQELVDALWSHYGARIIANRDLPAATFEAYTQRFPDLLVQAGDMATVALEHHLVDELLTPDELRARIADTVDYADNGEFKGIGYLQYLASSSEEASESDNLVGVITASGPIVTGRARGVVASERIIDLIREARRDDDLSALVLRINSPGGSSFASELIRQELELVQLAGKPVVVSMGNVAASGGYWIAATADKILAEPTTITGSIGVFGIVPTFEDSLERLGITSDGVRTTPLSGLDTLSGLNSDMARILQINVEHTYAQFLNLVARGRDMAPERVDEVAQGRVWIGDKALELGLVDDLGALADATDAAAELAGLEDYEVRHLSTPLSARELLLGQFLGEVRLPDHPLLGQLREAWQWLEALNDPLHSYALCEACAVPSGTWFH